MTSQAALAAMGTGWDYAIIAFYFVFILSFGSFFGRFSKSTRDFFFSGQRFSWWLIAMSMAATGVGSYSFVKYSQKGFEYGLSSSMTYMNDWFFMPFFMFGWLPIIYFSRVKSIPEYFERRFGTKCRIMAVIFMLMYMIGYIGYNFFTLGTVTEALLDVNLYTAMSVIALISAVYIAVGGQTAVIFTDLVQGLMLISAGLLLFFLGLWYLGGDGGLATGLPNFWSNLTLAQRLPFSGFNKPPDFNFVGIFWQDGVASSITFLFINQGLIMRFMAAKSMTEGRRTILFNVCLILPLSMIVVGNAGWLGRAMVGMGILPDDLDPTKAFVTVASLVCLPGVFGFVLAALTAALMSTIDTLTNATSAVLIYDVYQPYIRPGRPDRHYLRAARLISLCTSAVGLGVGCIFAYYGEDMYYIHAKFIGIVTPPIVVAVFLGAFWKRYTPTAAFWSMLGGGLLIWISTFKPGMIKPFADLFGVGPDGKGDYGYMRSLFGLVTSGAIGVIISLFTRPKPQSEIAGLWIGSMHLARKFFKGGQPNFEIGQKIVAGLKMSAEGTTRPGAEEIRMPDAPAHQPPASYAVVRLATADMERMKVKPGDLLYVGDSRRWLGGLRSLHCRAGQPHDQGNVVLISEEAFKAGSFIPTRPVRVEKFF
ncbi:MAG TPA: sodium/solute symporter [Phycisphaerae bacterium]|nr:sodium/solute symporter [Phycisphaerae bacterium]